MTKRIFLILSIAALFMTSCDRRSAAELYQDAEALIKSEKVDDAVKDLTRIEKKFPESEFAPKSMFKLAELYMNEYRDIEKAIGQYMRTAETHPTSPYGAKSRFMAGFYLANYTSRFDEAKNQYEIFLKQYPEDELKTAVEFELENLGKDIEDIPQLQNLVNPEDEKDKDKDGEDKPQMRITVNPGN